LSEQAAEALRRVTPGEWSLLIKVLTRYARNRSRRLGWRTENSDELPGGETPGSIVSKAITLVLRGAFEGRPDEERGVKAGVRRWDPQKDPDLKKYLMDVVKSVLNHLAEGEENSIFQRVPVGEDAREWEERLNRPTADREWLARGGETPEEILLRKEAASLRTRALQMLREEVGDDAVLSRVVKSMNAGNSDAADISKDTGIPAKQIYNAAKRLDRKGAAVRRKLQQAGATPGLEEGQR
jgi:hypothetical protein